MIISTDAKTELVELIEDTVQYFCDHQIISGEVAWIAVGAMAEAKLAEMHNEKG